MPDAVFRMSVNSGWTPRPESTGKFQRSSGTVAPAIEAEASISLLYRIVAVEMEQYAAYFNEAGNYTYDRDDKRPGWYPLIPNERWAN